MNIIAVINQIIMLFIITGIGWYLQRVKVLTDDVIKGINAVVMKAAWPCMILMTTQKQCTDETLRGFILVACVTTAILLVACVGVYMFCAKGREGREAPVFAVLSVMPNAGFVGMPIIQAVYGDEGVLYLAAFLVGFNLVLWTVGVFLFAGVSVRSLKCIINPGFIASVVGTALFVLRIALPKPLLSTVTQMGSLTTPLPMLLLGARLVKVKWRQIANLRLWISMAVKLLAMPLLTMVIMRLVGASETLTGITVLAMAMPSAAAAQMFAEKHENNVEVSVQGVSVSMLLCIITIPLILLIAGI